MTASPPFCLYDSDNLQKPVVEEVSQLYRYRSLLRLLIESSLKTRYKRSVLGVAWTLLNPILQMTVLTIAFSALFRFNVPNYPVYVLSGLILWTFFSQTTLAALGTLVWGSSLIKRVYLPPSVFPISAMGSGLVNLVFSLLPLFGVMIVFRHPFRPALLFLPVSTVLILAFSLGLSLLLATIAIHFTDIVDMYNVVLRAWFFLTPIMYPEEIFPESYRWVLLANPMYHQVKCWTVPVYEGTLPDPVNILTAAITALAMLALGWWVFASRTHEFAYRA